MGERWRDACWLIVVGLISSASIVASARHMSATFDEPCHIERGLYGWRTGSIKPLMSAGCMPLPVDVQTLPLYIWERYRGTPFDAVADIGELLPVARMANLAFWWLLLLYAMRLGRAFGGAWAGRFACGFIATDPNFLGHAALATTDIAITATTLVAIFHYHTGAGCSWFWRVGVPGVCYGIAVTAKASAMAFVPLGFFAFGLFKLYSSGALAMPTCGLFGRVRFYQRATSALRWDIFWSLAIGCVYVFAYCGSDWQTERTFVEWAHGLSEGSTKDAMVPVAENLRIFTNAGEGLMQQVKHNFRGHGSYLHGDWYPRACWYYFPYALTVKLPETTLVLLAVALLLRTRAFFGPVGVLTLVLFAFSLNCRVQIGIRLVFPLVAMLYISSAIAVANARIPRGIGGLVLLANALIACSIWPNGLRYANITHGGPDGCYRYLSDSNADWGQGLKPLEAWCRANGTESVAVWYYGTDPDMNKPPFRIRPLHSFAIATNEQARAYVGPGYLAVSTTILKGDPAITPQAVVSLGWLKTQTPIDRVGTFAIYDVR